MPRFTIGSLSLGLLLALVAVAILNQWGGILVPRPAVGTPAPGPRPIAVDPARGTLALDQERANDFDLEDGSDWTGGLDAATW